jgi:hypothetical protein
MCGCACVHACTYVGVCECTQAVVCACHVAHGYSRVYPCVHLHRCVCTNLHASVYQHIHIYIYIYKYIYVYVKYIYLYMCAFALCQAWATAATGNIVSDSQLGLMLAGKPANTEELGCSSFAQAAAIPTGSGLAMASSLLYVQGGRDAARFNDSKAMIHYQAVAAARLAAAADCCLVAASLLSLANEAFIDGHKCKSAGMGTSVQSDGKLGLFVERSLVDLLPTQASNKRTVEHGCNLEASPQSTRELSAAASAWAPSDSKL